MQESLPEVVEYNSQRILTSQQIAELYETDLDNIKKNFSNNKDRFTAGKHYFYLEGKELKRFKNEVKIPDLVGKRASSLYLWTEKGALLHAKSLGTDAAWEMYERLVDEYYRLKAKEEEAQSEQRGFLNSLYVKRIQLFSRKTKIPARKYCVFERIVTPFLKVELQGVELPEGAVPDISVGNQWCKYAREILRFDMELVKKHPHHYPDKRGVQMVNIYPIEWLPEFEIWFQEVYIPDLLPGYLKYLKATNEQIRLIMKAFGINYRVGGENS